MIRGQPSCSLILQSIKRSRTKGRVFGSFSALAMARSSHVGGINELSGGADRGFFMQIHIRALGGNEIPSSTLTLPRRKASQNVCLSVTTRITANLRGISLVARVSSRFFQDTIYGPLFRKRHRHLLPKERLCKGTKGLYYHVLEIVSSVAKKSPVLLVKAIRGLGRKISRDSWPREVDGYFVPPLPPRGKGFFPEILPASVHNRAALLRGNLSMAVLRLVHYISKICSSRGVLFCSKNLQYVTDALSVLQVSSFVSFLLVRQIRIGIG